MKMSMRISTPTVFFRYFGSKVRMSRTYPYPRHTTVVEPFAGASGYSTFHARRIVRAILCDVDPVVAGIWSYLIRASEEEVLRLPLVRMDDDVNSFAIPQEAKWLIGMWMNIPNSHGTCIPSTKPSKYMQKWSGIYTNGFWGEHVRERIARNMHLIRGWEARCCRYDECEVAGDATWMIDPPYQRVHAKYAGMRHDIDYGTLGNWCRSRRGQVIVSESMDADWLHFRPANMLRRTRNNKFGKRHSARAVEALWLNDWEEKNADVA